jgi:hypothetical protein
MKLSPSCYQKNELEMFFKLAEKALADKTGGAIFQKGTELESRMSYQQAIEVCKSLEAYFAVKGAFSFSICKSCNGFNPRCSSREHFGTCGDTLKYEFETCSRHTPNKEAWGL